MNKILLTAMAVALALAASACGGKTEQAQTPETTQESAEVTAATQETEASEAETMAAAISPDGNYYVLQGTVVEVDKEGEQTRAFTLETGGKVQHTIQFADVRDVETEIKKGAQVAIGCVGGSPKDLQGAVLVVALAGQDKWEIKTVAGVTTANAMSTFELKTEDETTVAFLKDNYLMDDHALENDEGDHVIVTYITGADGENYPLEVQKAE